jgi:hypothetical protein
MKVEWKRKRKILKKKQIKVELRKWREKRKNK